jgi:hypothetical protein
MSVVRFPVEQCRLPGETREAFAARQADEQFWEANFAADGAIFWLDKSGQFFKASLDASIERLKRGCAIFLDDPHAEQYPPDSNP